MPPDQNSARLALVLLAAGLAAACSRESHETAPAPKQAPRPAQASADFTAAVAMGAPAAGLKLQFRLASAPRVGMPSTLELKLLASEAVQQGELKFGSEQGLRLAEGAKDGAAIGALAAGAEQSVSVDFVPEAEGVYLLQVNLRADTLGGPRSGRWGIPVMVVSPEAAPAEAAATAPAPAPAPASDAAQGR